MSPRISIPSATGTVIAAIAAAMVAGAFVNHDAEAAEQKNRVGRTQTDQSRLEKSRAEEAALWGLNKEEWARYEQLKKGIRGYISPNISPIEALGIHARNEQERRHYAERWARMMYEDTERVIAFTRAYTEAFARLYPNTPLVDVTKFPDSPYIRLQPGDKLVLIVGKPCQEACQAVATEAQRRLIERPDADIRVDVHFAGPWTNEEIQQWALQARLDPKVVNSHRMTLNPWPAAPKQQAEVEVPNLYLLRGKDRRRVELGNLLWPVNHLRAKNEN